MDSLPEMYNDLISCGLADSLSDHLSYYARKSSLSILGGGFKYQRFDLVRSGHLFH